LVTSQQSKDPQKFDGHSIFDLFPTAFIARKPEISRSSSQRLTSVARYFVMELKVVCHCGQKYKFDVEPVNRQMPFKVACPICGLDGTGLANNMLMQMPPPPPSVTPPPIPVATLVSAPVGLAVAAPVAMAAPVAVAAAASAAPASGGLRVNRLHAPTGTPAPVIAAPVAAPMRATAAGTAATAPRAMPKYLKDDPSLQNNNFLLGVVGAFLGAIVGVAFLVGAQQFFGFTLSYFAVIAGALIGFGARLLYRGTSSTLGAMCAGLAFFTLAGTLFYLDGLIGLALDLLYLVVGCLAAFKVAS
jgi:hypothetical protein